MVTKADIMLVRSLADKNGRTASGLFVVEGRKMVSEAISSGLTVRRIYSTEEFSDLKGVTVVPRKDIERMSRLKAPQGVLALVEIPRRRMPGQPGAELSLVLDSVQDPGNLGTILRIADWFGIADIFCTPDSADCFNPKAVQASMGAVTRTRVHYTDIENLLSEARRHNIEIYGTFLEGENIYRAEIGNPTGGLVVLGNEGSGISPRTAQYITRKLFIPPWPAGRGSAESLNVAAAAAVVCSEMRRRSQHEAEK